MQITLDSLKHGAKKATGTVIIIDVFRAFTTAAVAFSKGANSIFLTETIEEAIELKKNQIANITMGEVNGIKPLNFDHGNSPYEISIANKISGLKIAQSTRSGTLGVSLAAKTNNSTHIFATGLMTAKSTTDIIKSRNLDNIYIVAMGYQGIEKTEEDEICALYLKSLLENKPMDKKHVIDLIMKSESAKQFNDITQPQFHPKDLEYALKIDSENFAMEITSKNKLLILKKIYN